MLGFEDLLQKNITGPGMITSSASQLVGFQYLSPLSHGELRVCLPHQG